MVHTAALVHLLVFVSYYSSSAFKSTIIVNNNNVRSFDRLYHITTIKSHWSKTSILCTPATVSSLPMKESNVNKLDMNASYPNILDEQSIASSSNKDPIKPTGPLGKLKRMAIISILLIQLSATRALNTVLSIFKPNTQQTLTPGKKLMRARINLIFKNLFGILTSKTFWLQFTLVFVSVQIIRDYLAYMKSMTVNVSYAAFMKLLETAPDKIEALRVTSSAFMFQMDGKNALTRIVDIDPMTMSKLIASGIDFCAPPAPMNILGFLITFVYFAFLWNISTRMMGGNSIFSNNHLYSILLKVHIKFLNAESIMYYLI